MHREADHTILRELESVAADHLAWIRRVHSGLLFDEASQARAVGIPPSLTSWVESPAASPGMAVERRDALAALRQAHRTMTTCAASLTQPPRREDYQNFMAGVEAFARALHRIEALLCRSLAETDPLTGVHNRLGMMRDLEREWQRAVRTQQPCCIALVDLDHFKRVNDTYGHPTGDRVLATAARFFTRRLRPYDRVYRYGGEEFLFLLPSTDLDMARSILDRLRTLMARLPVPLDCGKRLHVTASIGIAEMSDAAAPPTQALAEADTAVYAAKREGRNRVCVWAGRGLHPADMPPDVALHPASARDARGA